MKVGDKVEVIERYDEAQIGTQGIIRKLNQMEEKHAIEITKAVGLIPHSCSGFFGGPIGYRIPSRYLKKIGKGKKQLKPTHIITWDTKARDPFCLVYSNKEKAEKVKELVAKDDVITTSIRVYTISGIEEADYKVILRKVKA